MTALMIVLVVLGLVIGITGALGITGKLQGNPVIGLRIPEARQSRDKWVLGHRIAGMPWIGAGVSLLAAAFATTLEPRGWLVWIAIVALVLWALALVGIGAAKAAHTLALLGAQEAQAEAASEGGCCSSGGCGDDSGSDPAAAEPAGATGVVSAEACASGNACGSCSLNGACSGGDIDFAAAQRAAAAQDSR